MKLYKLIFKELSARFGDITILSLEVSDGDSIATVVFTHSDNKVKSIAKFKVVHWENMLFMNRYSISIISLKGCEE